MEKETRNCQNCKQDFVIEPDDFAFYEKISVPPPTFCPECRLVRRLAFRNEKRLYRRKSALSGEDVLCIYPPEFPYLVYSSPEWFSDAWDAVSYGRDYDFNRPFFEQFKELMASVPLIDRIMDYPTMINSDYTNYAGHLKNCYLISEADFDENCAYASSLKHSKDSMEILMGQNVELCYECINCRRCHSTYFSEDCEDCVDVLFSKNCIGCSHCAGCVNLRKKQYHIFNRPYTKDEYFKVLGELHLESARECRKVRENSMALWAKFPQKYMHERHNVNVSGDYVYYSKNAFRCDEAVGVQDGKFCNIISLPPVKDAYDYTEWGNGAELLYECLSTGEGAFNVRFSNGVWTEVRNIEYSFQCQKSSDLFGCIGLKNKKFCILNKQYSESEFATLRAKIIQHMNAVPYIDKGGRVYAYGEFFPIELSPVAFNDTTAQQFFPITKDVAMRENYLWRDDEERKYEVTLRAEEVPDTIQQISDSIVNDVIGCEHGQRCFHQCTQAFRVTTQELELYKKMNVPVPQLCPNCRHFGRIVRRNPLRFWRRRCQCAGIGSSNGVYTNTIFHFHGASPCPNEFETSYSPDRSEIVYCEQCYSAEVA